MKNVSMVIMAASCLAMPVLAANDTDAPLPLVPQPAKVERGQGAFRLKADTRIVVDTGDADARNVGEQLAARLKQGAGLDLKIEGTVVAPAILLTRKNAKQALGTEGYVLTVRPEGVVIAAPQGAGLFYGMQTFLQLLPPAIFGPSEEIDPKSLTVPAVTIEDKPRFAWRGLLLDSSRHFFTKQEVKDFLDVMAQQKLNTLQWHLTDSVGWRLEIKKYPKLTEDGAWRDHMDFPEHNIRMDPKSSTAYRADGKYGGFYTQDEIREIVAYAKQHYINIVPEIEMPGHSGAAMRSYPQLGCEPGAEEYCAGNDEAFAFLQDVLTEVMELFPCKFIHVGGDEVDKGHWSQCPKCQARKKAEGLKDEHGLQSYFIRCMGKFINSKGRRMVGWSEIRQGGIAANAVLTDWIGGGAESAREGHDVVMTPQAYCYFDHYQATSGEPEAWGGFTPLSKVYSLEPVPGGLNADEAKHILGAQGNLWAERIPNARHLQYMAYPRACALAEVTWTEESLKDWSNFRQRMETHVQRLAAQGVNFRSLTKPVATATVKIAGETVQVEMPWGTYQNNTMDRAFDGKDDTFFWNDADLSAGDSVTFKFPAARRLHAIKVLTGKPDRPADIMADGDVLEASTDGKTWQTVAVFKNAVAEGKFTGEAVQGIRLRVKSGGKRWLVIRELTVMP